MEPKELIYNVYKDITSIKTKFDDENLWCNPYKTIQGLTPMTPGYAISMEYVPHIDIEEYFSEEFIEKLKLLFKEYHIHLNAQPKEGQENPSIIQIILISKKLTTITIK